ncbi:Flagellar protein FliS [bacterium HR17]|jgi:flagellar protein FliS|uniref:Flagellar protein FliS n=1 Tax=Candidatus Fervidibacter japonicus TaxID=2035412 RepID=A0A2H5XG11_9BACT|nr:Flagellar protein FliS [bacterium HR17]
MLTDAYLRQMVETATPVQLIGLLFRRGGELMDDAERALTEGRMDDAHFALTKAQQVVAELLNALDTEKGGDIAVNLRRLYTFVWERLLHANLRKSVEPLKDARQVWEQLSQLWSEVEAREGGA